jgi:hypothetical protein
VTPRDDLRDRIVSLLHDYPSAHEIADRLINAGLVDASNAREGVVFTRSCIEYGGERLPRGTRVLVLAEDAS